MWIKCGICMLSTIIEDYGWKDVKKNLTEKEGGFYD